MLKPTNEQKHGATEATQCLKNDSWWRLLRKGWRQKRLETGAAPKGEARHKAKTQRITA
jgi:hypothetical protein